MTSTKNSSDRPTLNRIWFLDNPDDKTKERRVDLFANSVRFRELLIAAIQTLYKNADRPATMKDYESPGWPYFQAHLQGYKRALLDIQTILVTEKDKN